MRLAAGRFYIRTDGKFRMGLAPSPKAATSLLYDGANNSRSRTATPYWARDSKFELSRWTRLSLLSKARWLYANDGFTRGAIGDMARYSVGDGLRPIAMSTSKRWNQAAEFYWQQWCKVADVTGRHDFNFIQGMLSRAIDRDGDIGMILVKTPTGFPQVQVIESHRIGNAQGDGIEWIDGVKIDRPVGGRPVAYRIIEGDVLVGQDVMDIPAANFIHFYEPERTDQLRGVTSLYHAINTLLDKKDIIDFEKIGVKHNSAIAAVLKKKMGKTTAGEWDDDAENPNNGSLNFWQMQSGEIPVIGEKDDVIFHNSGRPSPAFTGFLEFLIRDVATGLGLPYEFIWNPEKLGGTSQRFVLAKAQRRFRERQHLFETKALNRLWFWVMSVGMKRGDIPQMDGAWQVRWQRPPELTVDAGRDANQDREDVKMGLMTQEEHFSRRGLDWELEKDQQQEEVDDLLTRAEALVEKHPDVPLQTAIQLLQLTNPNAIAPPPGGGSMPPPGSPENNGNKQAPGQTPQTPPNK